MANKNTTKKLIKFEFEFSLVHCSTLTQCRKTYSYLDVLDYVHKWNIALVSFDKQTETMESRQMKLIFFTAIISITIQGGGYSM